ncbi:MAG: type II toxin-antitoxin system RelE/ParE family toxin [Cryomorphaceae bacterium]|nr:type II toxin-antitoxin system RelE/ParE family toxin [Cryomorphaceae bacterium]
MEVTIEWSELSAKQLNDIFDYYSLEASPRVARQLINKIIQGVEILHENPFAGPKEELLSKMSEDFHYLVISNYKIIYWIDNKRITIASIFDCRQNPEKLRVK